jgi:hypothetical protein
MLPDLYMLPEPRVAAFPSRLVGLFNNRHTLKKTVLLAHLLIVSMRGSNWCTRFTRR